MEPNSTQGGVAPRNGATPRVTHAPPSSSCPSELPHATPVDHFHNCPEPKSRGTQPAIRPGHHLPTPVEQAQSYSAPSCNLRLLVDIRLSIIRSAFGRQTLARSRIHIIKGSTVHAETCKARQDEMKRSRRSMMTSTHQLNSYAHTISAKERQKYMLHDFSFCA